MKDEIVRSPLFYVGDKYKLIREIRSHFPQQIGRLIEPFVGGGSVFMNTGTPVCLANDIDYYVIQLHKWLCGYKDSSEILMAELTKMINHYHLSFSLIREDVPADLRKEYPKTYFAKFNKAAYTALRQDFNNSGKTDLCRLYLLLIYGFNRMLRFNGKGDFNLPVGNVDFNQNTKDAIENYLAVVSQRQVSFSSLDFRIFLKGIDFKNDDLVYLDPPYLITFSEYNKLWNENAERDLLSILDELNNRGVRFAISNVTHYKGRVNSIFSKWMERYNVYPIKSNYISFNDNTIKKFSEVLITNY
ncbi:MAG: Dam family site-specific DNA-(adenine-N6)-methyltransferase [Bacteroidales bacterium]|nr:Dam family site-specific DNA-(adenine-N6)-methyltransferase [Bacteroidales bacterium]